MQADFESVIERKIHAWFNYMEGVMHTGQRNQIRIRVSNAAYDAGLRLKHFGEVLYHMIMDEFDAVVDKCEVTLMTDRPPPRNSWTKWPCPATTPAMTAWLP